MRQVYLDNNATTRIDPAVFAAMLPFYTEHFGNASSSHIWGREVAEAIRAAREQVASLVGAAHPQEIIFTSGGTESDNTAVLSALATQPGRNEIVISAVEHPAVLQFTRELEKQCGAVVRTVPVDERGRLDLNAYRAALGPKTAIASVMWANNETGTIFPVAELATLAHQAGALFHTDAVQAAGRAPLDLKSMPVDMASVSAHKLNGPKGIGALYLRKGVRFAPLIRGGKQERGRRAGTENAPAIIGFGMAAELAEQALALRARNMAALRDRFEANVLREIRGCRIAGDIEARLPNTSNIIFAGAEGEVILSALGAAGVAASSGSACTSGSTEPSHVLLAMRVPYFAALGAIRFSLSHETTVDDIDYVAGLLPAIVSKARDVSDFGEPAMPMSASASV